MESKATTAGVDPAKRKRVAENTLLNFVKRVRVLPDDKDSHNHNDSNATDNAAHDHAVTPSSAPSIADDDTASFTATAFTSASAAGTGTGNGNGTGKFKSQPRAKRLECPYDGCLKMFSRPVHLQNHLNSHTGERPHACSDPTCDKTFLKREHLVRHMKEKHGNETFTCTYTTRNHITGVLEPCNKQFPSAQKYKRHFAVHEEKEETTCSWEGCSMVFRKQETLQRHIKKDHLNEDSFFCTRPMRDGSACGQSFPTPGQLRSHVHREHEPPRHYCKICTCAANPLSEADVVRPVENGLDPEFLPTPEDTLSAREGLDANTMQSLNLNDQPIMLPAEAIVSFPTYHELQRHTTLMHPPTCTECGKKCKTAKDLTAHIEIHHPPNGQPIEREKKFVCPHEGCVRSTIQNGFTSKGNMAAHVRSVHAAKKKFICGEFDLTGNERVERWNRKGCGLSVTTKQSLINHIRTQHLGIPVYMYGQAKATDIVPRPKRGKASSLSKQSRAGAEDDDDESEEDEDEGEQDYDQMDLDKTSKNSSVALTMLTGSGYDELRPIACLKSGCMVRFTTMYEMCFHLELTHGWSVEDINEATGREETEFLSSEELRARKLEADLATEREETEFLSSEELLRRQQEANGQIDPQLT